MAKKGSSGDSTLKKSAKTPAGGKPSSLLDTRVIYCGDNVEQLAKLPDSCVDPIYIDPVVRRSNNPSIPIATTKSSGGRPVEKSAAEADSLTIPPADEEFNRRLDPDLR